MALKEQLQAALDLFGPNGEHWSKGYYAHTVAGEEVEYDNNKACKWCCAGALLRAHVPNRGWILLEKHLKKHCSLAVFNDDPHTKFAGVKALFKKAIKEAQNVNEHTCHTHKLHERISGNMRPPCS
jgi:hypothetical protein